MKKATLLGMTVAALAATAQPALAAREVVAPKTLFACPEHTSGDRDFWGYGPEVDATLTLRPNGSATAIEVLLYMTMRETAGDRTGAEVNKAFTIATAPGATRFTKVWLPDAEGTYSWLPIQKAVTVDRWTLDYTDGDRELDVFEPEAAWLRRVEVMGDTKDNDVGYGCGNLATDSHIRVFTDELYFWYQ